ncbi:hypothetical protein [Agathobacter rectalis]|uniref:hypothetical protein n=1 Tax=Agathobacter rectalis TaxID=39491 RepID=UPI0026983794|nr:hypothetical protein [Agathobacter rectalis]
MVEKEYNLELATSMVHQFMPEFSSQKNAIILCDSGYTKQNWLYQYDSVFHLVMYKDPQGDSLWHPLWPGSEYVDHEDRPPDDA